MHFIHKGQRIEINPVVKTQEIIQAGLNNIQLAHLNGELNIYEPIEAYAEKWHTKFRKCGYWEDYESAHPIPNTRVRSDLPPIYMQWKDSAKK